MLERYVTAYTEAIFDTDRDRALAVVVEAQVAGLLAEDILFKIVLPSIDRMMKSVSESCDISLAQHFMASQIASEVAEVLIPQFQKVPQLTGCVVLGTAPGDFHGLGKRIVAGCLQANVIEVVDLGLSVSAERFVDEAVAHGAQVIGISSLMIHTATGPDGCLKVRQILRERRLEDSTKIAVGGAPFLFDHELYKVVQADGWAENAVEAVRLITTLIQEVKR